MQNGGNQRTFLMDGAPVGFGLTAETGMVSPVQSPQRSRQNVSASDEDNCDESEGEEEYDDDQYEDDQYEHEQEGRNDDEDSGDVGRQIIGNEENVPKMPEDFYSDVDSFLNRPPPKVKGGGKKSKTKQKLDEKITKSASLPVLVSRAPAAPKLQVESKINTGRSKGPGKKQKGGAGGGRGAGFDMDLLAQAFQYSEKLQREALDEELMQDQSYGGSGKREGIAMKKSGSAPTRQSLGQRMGRDGSSATSAVLMSGEEGTKRGHASGGEGVGRGTGGNMARKLRNKTKGGKKSSQTTGGGRREENGSFDTSVQSQSDLVSRNAVDFDALVANFEQGLTLHKLRAELQESQTAMERSKKAMQHISRDASSKLGL